MYVRRASLLCRCVLSWSVRNEHLFSYLPVLYKAKVIHNLYYSRTQSTNMGSVSVEVPVKERATHLFSMTPAAPISSDYMQRFTSIPLAPIFWGAEYEAGNARPFPPHTGNVEVGELIGDGSVEASDKLVDQALDSISSIFTSIDNPDPKSRIGLVDLHMCPELARWKDERQRQGRVLPHKGKGLARTTDKVVELLECAEWPEPLLTTNALFGVGFANFLIGAYDPKVLYSNCCIDMGFYYEHGYDRLFPEFEPLFLAASNDPHARTSFAGYERREAAKTGLRYIRGKVELERKYLPHLTPGRSAKFDRNTAAKIMFAESSEVGLAVEAMTRGHDVPAATSDMCFSSPVSASLSSHLLLLGSDLIAIGYRCG